MTKKKDPEKRKNPQKIPVAIRLSEEMIRKIDEIAERYGVNRPTVIRNAIIELLRRERNPDE